jgi:hypothetical protein
LSQVIKTKNKTNCVALSPRANYTDWSTATCRRNLVSTFVDRGVSLSQVIRTINFFTFRKPQIVTKEKYLFSFKTKII